MGSAQASHSAVVKHRVLKLAAGIFYLLLQCTGFVIYSVPFVFKRVLAEIIADVWFYVIRFRIRIILHNLALVFPRKHQESNVQFQRRCEELTRKNLQHMVLLFFEIIERFHWTKERVVPHRLRIDGMEHVQHLIDQKKGIIFLSAHLGNWELITMSGIFYKIPVVIITKFLRNPFFDALWVKSREQFGLELLQERGSGLAAARAVKSGKSLGFILDQHTGEPHGIEHTFLGLKAWCPKGLAILSTKLKCPVVPSFIIREANGSLVTTIEEPLDFPEIKNQNPLFCRESGNLTDEGIRYHISRCNETMERWILKYPEQYLWMHRRFKNLIDYRSSLPWEL